MYLLVLAAVAAFTSTPKQQVTDCIIDGREMRCVVMKGPDGLVAVPYHSRRAE